MVSSQGFSDPENLGWNATLRHRGSVVGYRMEMRGWLGVVAAVAMTAHAAAGDLDALRWKKRVLVVTPGNASATVDAKLAKDSGGLAERDVVVYFLKQPGGRSGEVADESMAAELRKRLSVKDGTAEVLLLGKDGRTTLRWSAAEFDLAKLFREIDSMPMRQKEMRKALDE